MEVSDQENLPDDVLEAAAEAIEIGLPTKSKEIYERTYENYVTWKRMKKISSTGEKVLLAYFQHLGKSLAPSTLWAKWSMLKTMVEKNEHININRYQKLKRLLKQKNVGYTCKKSPTLSSEDIQGFLVNAPNKDHLADKVALIVGVTGA
ncbi:hypothetical protein QAD02_000622 [Eretmocerus hayati]|uniref:Uncharacterized protein n=1 Tax=Eretmocerus hayati TaxID=131215 RepID=A0ACC2NEZ6_9HYME|nr:hypothetical protein QAD02_000622 [Eretmocerus hayati]